jgi:very-short-patch-repair endonuclease
MTGIRFRRQHPLGRYILDFYAPAIRLVIEVDGDVHKYQMEEDAIRTRQLQEYGYHVIRFANDEITHDMPGVLSRIDQVINTLNDH